MGIVNNCTTIATTTETVTKDKMNGLAGPLITEFNGSIDNDNIKASAGIVDTKLAWTAGSTVPYVTGIKFVATAVPSTNANTLDDYEEGTWTPNCYHTGSNDSTFTSKGGLYVKVGGMVTVWFVCDTGNTGTAGSQLAVTDLPFTGSATNLGNSILGTWGASGSIVGNVMYSDGTIFFLNLGNSAYTTQKTFVSGCFSYRAA